MSALDAARRPPEWAASAGGLVRSFERYLHARRPRVVVVTWEGVFAGGRYRYYSAITAKAHSRRWVFTDPGGPYGVDTDYPFNKALERQGYELINRSGPPGHIKYVWRRPRRHEEVSEA